VIDPATGMQQLDNMGQPVPPQKAFPPRRFIKVAKEFGENATIQSICSDDFTPAVDQIIDIIARQLGSVCLPRKLVANSEGKVNCDIIWELPLPHLAMPGTRSCAERPELLDFPANGRPQMSTEGRQLCVVKQVPVVDCAPGSLNCFDGHKANSERGPDPMNPLNTNGWYYDDFSEEVADCTGASRQRIAFTNNNGVNAQPPSGVTVRLECLQEAASVVVPRNDVVQGSATPSIGSPCDNDSACHVALLDLTGTECSGTKVYRSNSSGVCRDTQMYCHPEQKVCVMGCQDKSQCLPGFECDKRDDSADSDKSCSACGRVRAARRLRAAATSCMLGWAVRCTR
jgi:hypothetical protein